MAEQLKFTLAMQHIDFFAPVLSAKKVKSKSSFVSSEIVRF